MWTEPLMTGQRIQQEAITNTMHVLLITRQHRRISVELHKIVAKIFECYSPSTSISTGNQKTRQTSNNKHCKPQPAPHCSVLPPGELNDIIADILFEFASNIRRQGSKLEHEQTWVKYSRQQHRLTLQWNTTKICIEVVKTQKKLKHRVT